MQTLKDVMSRDVQVISPNGTIREAALRMLKGNFGMMPVEENDRMIGTVSDRDITIHAVAQGKDSNTQVREVMSEGIICAFENDTVADAARLMAEHQVRRLPVMNVEKRLVGIISLGDLALDKKDVAATGEALAEISQPV